MIKQKSKKFFFASICAHFVILFLVLLSVDYTSEVPVFENTNHQDVISAIALGDTDKSKILPTKVAKQKQPPLPKPEKKPIVVEKKEVMEPVIKKEAIALAVEKKPIEKKVDEKKQNELLASDLLKEIKKKELTQKKQKQKELQEKFAKMLEEQSEKTLRQKFFNEEIKLQTKESHAASGVVDKYKALILQAISQHWLVPTQANKKLFCELMITVAPGGLVTDVVITKTSGDPSLDSSARAAVFRASPLPVPSKEDDFAPFRHFVLKVKPENILSQG